MTDDRIPTADQLAELRAAAVKAVSEVVNNNPLGMMPMMSMLGPDPYGRILTAINAIGKYTAAQQAWHAARSDPGAQPFWWPGQ